MRAARGLLLAALVHAACVGGDDGDDASAGEAPDFPENYADDYVEVRDCRGSGDHDLHTIRILADPAALAPYQDRGAPFPVGAVVLKEEYEFGDLECAGPIVQWTVMRRLAPGSAADNLDWAWQRVDPQRQVVDSDAPRCVGCHQGCGAAPDGYEGTCAVP
ncbi:MAG: cytochrome P460 family protein [Nannocystaceae bacterium]